MSLLEQKNNFKKMLMAVKNSRVTWGPLVVLLFCLNGGIALFYGMLHNRLEDSKGFFIVFSILSSLALLFYWISRALAQNRGALRSSAGGVANAHGIGDKASRGSSDKRRNKKRESKKKHRR